MRSIVTRKVDSHHGRGMEVDSHLGRGMNDEGAMEDQGMPCDQSSMTGTTGVVGT
jgi:hypothetical protein